MIPVASSCTSQLVHTVATVSSTITSGCMGSRGASEMVKGDGSLHRQAITSLKPGGRVTSGIGSGDPGGDVESCSA